MGYVIFTLISCKYIPTSKSISSITVSADTSRDLLNRLEQDVLNVEADTVFMMIGVNDVWQRFEPHIKMRIYPEDFSNYRTIIEAIQKNN